MTQIDDVDAVDDQPAVDAAAAPAAPRRSGRLHRATTWAASGVLVAAVTTGAVGFAQPDEQGDPTQALYPRDAGTSWLYTTTTDGKDTGLAFDQVTGRANLLADVVDVIRSHFDDFVGRGQPLDQTVYLQARNGTLWERGSRSNGTYRKDDPPVPTLPLAARRGSVVHWKGKQGTDQATIDNTFVGVERVVVRGHSFDGCRHNRVVTTTTGASESTDTFDSWLCPGVGPVRSTEHYVGGSTELQLNKDLLAFSGPKGTLRLGQLPARTGREVQPVASAQDARLQLDRLAWSDLHADKTAQPPVSDGTRMLTVGEDAVVSLTDTRTGQVMWRQQVTGPVVGTPAVAGDVALVADAHKTLLALDAITGQVRWRRAFPDVVSSGPVVVGDRAVVATEDGAVRALSLTDGAPAWTSSVDARVMQPLAADDKGVYAVDDAGGLVALDARDGGVRWSDSLSGAPVTGPVLSGGRVVTADDVGHVVAHRVGDGRLEWDTYRDRTPAGQLAAAGGDVLLPLHGNRLELVDGRTGGTRWTAAVPATPAGAPLAVGQQAVVVTESGRLLTYRLADGRPGGSTQLGRGSRQPDVPFGPAVVDGAVVVVVQGALGTPEQTFAVPFDGRQVTGLRFAVTTRPLPANPLFAAAGSPSDFTFVGLGPSVWHVGPAGGRRLLSGDGTGTFAIAAGDVVLTQQGSQLQARRKSDGSLVWHAPMTEPQPGTAPVVVGAQVVTPLRGAGLASYDLSTGTPRWLVPIPPGANVGTTSPLPLPNGDVLYAPGPLLRVSATGQTVWTGPDVVTLAGITADDSTAYVVGFEGQLSELLAVDLATGAVRWRRPFDLAALQPPVVAGGGVAVIDGSSVLHVFDAATGEPRWSVPIGGTPSGPPVAMGDAVVVYTAGDTEQLVRTNARVAAYAASDGRFLARFQPTGADVGMASFGRFDDRRLFVAGSSTTPLAHLLTLETR